MAEGAGGGGGEDKLIQELHLIESRNPRMETVGLIVTSVSATIRQAQAHQANRLVVMLHYNGRV
jgi:hypothetical protein